MERSINIKKSVTRAPKVKFGIVVSDYNGDITKPMLEGAVAVLREAGVVEKNLEVVHVPGSFEIPFGALRLIKKKCSVVIAIGCIIKGETDHDRYIAQAVVQGITALSLERGVPIIFGVITANTLAQAQARAHGEGNKGREAAHAALQMAAL